MKIWIVGSQGTGKYSIARMLEKSKMKVGKIFTNSSPQEIKYHKDLYKFYSSEDIRDIFENNAYVFMTDIQCSMIEGLDLNEYENNDVFVLTIEQFLNINTKYVTRDDLIVWLDGNWNWRKHNLEEDDEKCLRELAERSCYTDFNTLILNLENSLKNILYFYNEDPERVKTIVKIIYNNPKLKSEFTKNFS